MDVQIAHDVPKDSAYYSYLGARRAEGSVTFGNNGASRTESRGYDNGPCAFLHELAHPVVIQAQTFCGGAPDTGPLAHDRVSYTPHTCGHAPYSLGHAPFGLGVDPRRLKVAHFSTRNAPCLVKQAPSLVPIAHARRTNAPSCSGVARDRRCQRDRRPFYAPRRWIDAPQSRRTPLFSVVDAPVLSTARRNEHDGVSWRRWGRPPPARR
jgi:hypothetical protein